MKKAILAMMLSIALSAGCAGTKTDVQSPADAQQTPVDDGNPFFAKSNLPFDIVDFSKIRPEHYLPAIEAGMAQQLAEIDAIASQVETPTFENTMIPLEKSGALLDRVLPYFSNDAGANTNDEIKAIQKVIAPKLSAHNDAIYLNQDLFDRISFLHAYIDLENYDPESRRLIEEYYKDFVLEGAMLDADGKARIREINQELAALTTAYGQNILSEMNDAAVIVDDVAELDGMSDEQIAAAAAAANDRGYTGKYLIAIQNTSIQPVLKSLNNRDLRRRIHEASISRGMHGNAADNSKNAFRIAELRAERAGLLGFATYADYVLEARVAKAIWAVNGMLEQLTVPAKASLAREAAELQKLIDAEGGGFQLEAYDWLYYAEKLRKQKYDLDDNALKPYFELDTVIRDGVFYAANQLYGLTFVERHDIPVYNPDVRVFEVFDADGKSLALFFGDYYARPSKRGGAWKSGFSSQSRLLGKRPVVINQINIAKPADGEKTLLTFDEVTTLFHEFGHALHEMFSDVTYPKFSGTKVPRDFVEFPSQFNEIWALWPGILEHYAKHTETGEVLPPEMVEKIKAAAKFNQGYMTTEYLGAAVLDMQWHIMRTEDVQALQGSLAEVEHRMLDEKGLAIATTPPRYRTAYYNHVFAGGYAAGYYAYIWSEVLDADAEAWFKAHGLSRANGDHLRKTVLSKGYSEDSMKLYRDFAGRDPQIDPLLIRRGLKDE